MTTPNKPDDRLKITYKGPEETEATEHEIFMSAGLLRRLAGLSQAFGDPSRMWTDAVAQGMMVVEMLSPRNKRGEEEKVYDSEDFEMTIEDSEKLVDWGREHVIAFFGRATQGFEKAITQAGNLKTLTDSLSGLQALVVEKQSAGLSTAEPVTSKK